MVELGREVDSRFEEIPVVDRASRFLVGNEAPEFNGRTSLSVGRGPGMVTSTEFLTRTFRF